MGDESDDVSETSSQKQSNIDVNIEYKNEKGFSCCSRKCGVVICAFCEKIMHKSCAKKMEHIKFIDGFHINCCNSEETTGILLRKSEEETVSTLGLLEIKLLETKNQFLTQLLESANEKNEILKLNNALLLQRIQDIERKTNVPQKNANEHHESVDNNSHHKVVIPVIKIDNLTDCSPASVTDDPRNMMLTENILSSSSATENPPSRNSKRKISNLSNPVLLHKNDQGMKLDQTKNLHTEKPIDRIEEPEKLSWTQVVKKKTAKQKQKSSLLCTGSRQVNPESKIKGAQRRKWLYVGKICGPHVTENDVRDFLKESTNQENFEVRKLPTRGNNSAFSVGVPSDTLYLELSKPASWPSGVVLREFNFRNFFRKDPISDAIVKICVPECDIYKNKRHKNKKKSPTRDGEDVKRKPQSSYSKEEILKCNPVKSCATISTQCDFSVNQTDTDVDIAKKLEVFEDLIPKISSVIERTEKNLEKEIQKARKSPKTVQERGVSPIKDILGTPPMARNQFEEKDQYTPQTPPNSPIHSVVDPISTQSKSYSPHIGNLLVNIQNIKDSRCLLNSFQNELIQLKTDIQNCSNCDEANENKGENNYCDKHIVYIPLLKMGEVGSKSDQIKLFNTLKTEVYLKKELENQIKHISKLERNLSRAKKLHEADKVKSIENELELAKSYFNNLLVKQQNERLLSEQQKIMSDNTTHKCENIETCGKCSLERQIHDLLEKVRMNIAQEIENSKQRLKIQRMPAIDIRNPLQLQNIFKLDIPPSKHPQAPKKSNFVYESVVKDDIAGDLNTNEEATQTKIVLSKSTSVELSTIIKKNKELEADIHKSSFKVRDDGEKKKDNIMKSHFTLTPSKHSLRTHKERSMNMEKTPSELGFRQNISTQCDSNTSFVDSGVLPCSPPKMTTHTQTVYSGNDSSYLFGFKEYLMKKTGDSFVLNPFSTNFQGSLDESNGSVVEFRTIGVNTEPSRTKVTKNRSCEFHGVTVVGSINEDIQEDEVSDISGDETEIVADPSRSYQDTIGEFQLISKTSSKSLKRIPSLKKMFLAPQKTSDAPHTDMEATIHNPYGEPKYRIKRFSTNRRESDSERKPQHDDYYKSLIEKEELPERKAAVLVDSPPVESRMSDEQSKIGETKNSDNLDVVEQDLSENKSKAGDVSPASYRDRRLESNKHLSDVFTEIITKLPSKRLTIPERLYEYMEDVEISHQGGRKNQNESSLITTNEEQNKVSTEEEEKAEEEEEVEEEKEEVREEEKEEEREEKQEEEGEEKQEEEREEEKDSSNRVEIIKAVTEEIELGSNPALQDSQYDDRTNTEEAENIEKPLDETQIIITQQPNDKNYGMPTSTVLTMLPTNYEFSLDKSRKYKIKLSDHNILLRLPESTKSFKRIEPSSKNTYMQSDEIILTEPNNSTRKISASYNNDGFIMTNSPQSKRDKTSITNYILHKPPVKNDIPCRYRSDLSNLTKERLEYSRKCSKMVDSSSLASSEGEVICKCKNISVGEIHSCPQGGNDLQSDHSGIEYKENLSSHIVLENQRKHYQHWVTYYTKKKYGHDSSSSSIEEK